MKILIVTYNKFPERDAESVRLHALGKLLRDLGHNVIFVCMGYSEYLKEMSFDGFKYVSLRKRNHYLSRVSSYIFYFNRLKRYVISCLNEEKIDVVLFADISPMAIYMLKKICANHNIKLIADCVEWYSPSQFKLGVFAPSMILKNIENRFMIDKKIGVIAISNYLFDYFQKKGCNCVRIPAILDVRNMPYRKEINSEKLTILYAGSPGKKDYIIEILRGVLLLDKSEISKLKFELAGVTHQDVKKHFSSLELHKLSGSVSFLGRIDRLLVIEHLSRADFTILLRSHSKRYAKAGFPTKVVESLATATPIILNITSDLGYYINDMREGLVISNCSAESVSRTIRRALALTVEQKSFMRENARYCAENNFDYRCYQNIIDYIVGK